MKGQNLTPDRPQTATRLLRERAGTQPQRTNKAKSRMAHLGAHRYLLQANHNRHD